MSSSSLVVSRINIVSHVGWHTQVGWTIISSGLLSRSFRSKSSRSHHDKVRSFGSNRRCDYRRRGMKRSSSSQNSLSTSWSQSELLSHCKVRVTRNRLSRIWRPIKVWGRRVMLLLRRHVVMKDSVSNWSSFGNRVLSSVRSSYMAWRHSVHHVCCHWNRCHTSVSWGRFVFFSRRWWRRCLIIDYQAWSAWRTASFTSIFFMSILRSIPAKTTTTKTW